MGQTKLFVAEVAKTRDREVAVTVAAEAVIVHHLKSFIQLTHF